MVTNRHERVLPVSAERIGQLIDGLSKSNDILWPRDRWPAMKFDRPLGIGATGGHGPIRYSVKSYQPGKSVCFQFLGPPGFIGTHEYWVEQIDTQKCKLVHLLEMRIEGQALLSWPLVFRPLHDALIEDSLDRAESFARGTKLPLGKWSPYVVILRKLLAP